MSSKKAIPTPRRLQQAKRNLRRPPRPRLTRAPFSQRLITAPLATTSVMSSNTGSSRATFPLDRKEFIADVTGSVDFALTRYTVNPGLDPVNGGCYPWGAGIANNFEEYETLAVSFHYAPSTSATNNGAVMIAFDYDTLDASPATKAQMLLYADNVRTSPWSPATLTLKASDLRKSSRKYTRSGNVANSDLKTYDLGAVYVATAGQASAAIIGEFWISYSHTLHTPQPSAAAAIAQHVTSLSPTSAELLPTPVVATGSSEIVSVAGEVLTFLTSGQFLVTLELTGTTISSLAAPAPANGASLVTTMYSSGYAAGGTGSAAFVTNVVVSAISNSTLTFNHDITAGATATLLVSRLPASLV